MVVSAISTLGVEIISNQTSKEEGIICADFLEA
jgi:hypothetical protein